MILPRQHAYSTTLYLLLALAGACWGGLIMRRAVTGSVLAQPAEGAGREPAPLQVWRPRPLHLDSALAEGLRADKRAAIPSKGAVAARYRLVGVMPGFVTAHGKGSATAIIETRASGTQQRLKVGDSLEPALDVASIERRAVWVRGSAGMERLTQDEAVGAHAIGTGAAAGSGGALAPGVRPLQRFGGKQVGEGNWEFKREAIVAYYQELLDQPERLLKVFDSLAPLYTEDRAIEGYRVNIEGEAGFFEAANLRQNDIVRKVNGIEMTNRRRAESLIKRFAQDDLEIVVLELEREGALVKQVYELR